MYLEEIFLNYVDILEVTFITVFQYTADCRLSALQLKPIHFPNPKRAPSLYYLIH